MHDDRAARKRPRDLAVLVGYVQAKVQNALVSAGKPNQVEQLNDLVAYDSPRLTIAELRIGLGDHDAIGIKRCGQPGKPTPLVRIADAYGCARYAHDLQIDRARRERDRKVVSAQPRFQALRPGASVQHDELVDVVVALHDDLVVVARDDREVRVGVGCPHRRDRRRRENQIADAVGAREEHPHERSARSSSSK